MSNSQSAGGRPWSSSSWRRRARGLGALVCLLGLLASGCASYGSYTWFSQLPRQEWGSGGGVYMLKPGDTISVRVFGQEGLTTPSKIRTDGRISLPFAGEIAASGKEPMQLATEIEARLKQFIVSPRVSVSLESSAPIVVTLLGEVKATGNQSLEPPGTLLQALAQAGGLSDFADDTAIFVVRRGPVARRIRFTYQALVDNENGAAAFPLKAGDVIVVE